MIVYDLSCANGHRFEGWFGSSTDFTRQREAGELACPVCESAEVNKAPMAPAVPRKGNRAIASVRQEAPAGETAPVANAPMPPEVAKALGNLAKAQTKALENSKWVGRKFADESRAMHYGEQVHAPIHGEASAEEARELLEEGVPVAPLPFPVAPPDKLN
ncbi:MAG: DUF1178 family protein [Alteraurantiacibacter sp.]